MEDSVVFVCGIYIYIIFRSTVFSFFIPPPLSSVSVSSRPSSLPPLLPMSVQCHDITASQHDTF